MKYLIEKINYYNVGEMVLIEYWYNGMITPVIIKEKVGRRYKISHKSKFSKIQNAPDELIKPSDIIDHYK